MERIPWSDSLSVGVDAIDAQHKTLVDMLNELHQAIAEDHGRQMLGTIVYKLCRHVQEHFAYEEAAMRTTKYLAQEGHLAQHNDFVGKVLELERELASGAGIAADEVWNFLRCWLVDHIRRTDRALGLHLNSCGMY